MLEEKNNISKMYDYWICFFVAIIISIYYYKCLRMTYIPFHSDDAGSTLALMDDRLYGGGAGGSYLKNNYGIFALIARLSTFIWGYSEFATVMVFVLQYFIMIYLLMLIILKTNQNLTKQNGVGVVLACVFLVGMQGTYGAAEIQISKFHAGPTIIILIVLLLLSMPKKRYIKVFITFCLLAALFQDDILLAICVCILPIILYYFKLSKHKATIFGLCLPVTVLACAANNIYYQVCGISIINFGGLYGNRPFSSFTVFLQNLSYYFSGLFGMFNCQITNRSIVDILFIINCIKSCMVVAGVIYAIWISFKFFIDGYDQNKIITISSIIIVVISLTYLLTGLQTDQISMRYCQVLLFLLPILIFDLLIKAKHVFDLSNGYYKWICFMLVLGICAKVSFRNTNENTYEYTDLTHKLEEMGSKLAIAPFWSSNVVSILSEGDILVQPCEVRNDQLYKSDISTISFFEDKCMKFDTIIASTTNNESYNDARFGMIPEKIEGLFDKPIDRQNVNDLQVIYRYDYDVRTVPIKLEKEDFGVDSKNNHLIYNYIYNKNFFGTYKIEIVGNDLLDNVDIECGNETDVRKIGNNMESAEFLVDVNTLKTKLPIYIILDKNTNADFSSVKIKVMNESKEILFDDRDSENEYTEELNLNKGKYILTLYGDSIKNIELDSNNSLITLQKKVDSKKRVKYQFSVKKESNVSFSYPKKYINKKVQCYIEPL